MRGADVSELMLIRGKISGVLTPRHEDMVSKSMLKTLEDAIGLLKTELGKVNRQLDEIRQLK